MSITDPYRLKISQLRALIAVAEFGNFSEAALQLQLSQSTVSHAIATLEEELGVQLLKRTRKGTHLTPVGERIVIHARQVLSPLEAIVKEADLEKGLQQGKVRVASIRSMATNVLPKVIARLRDRFPTIIVKIQEFEELDEIEKALRSERADIGFTHIPSGADFDTWELLIDNYIALLPPNSRVNTPQLTWEHLSSHPLIVSTANSCSDLIRNYISQLNLPMSIAYEIREDSTILSMVMQGLGVAIMPRLAAEPIPAGIQVYDLPVPLSRTLGAVMLKKALHPPAVFAFLDALKQTGQFRHQ